MRHILVAAVAAFTATSAGAETLAVCGPVKGRAFFVEGGLVTQKDAGWGDDQISTGSTTLSRNSKGELDIVYSDATGASYSSRGEGAIVTATRMGASDAAVLVAYPGATVEIYQFVRDAKGVQRVMLLQSKGGGPIGKAGVLVGQCSYLNLR